MNKTVTLLDGSEFTYFDKVDIEVVSKVVKLPYLKLRKLVALGGVKFHSTPSRFDLASVLDEIEPAVLERLYNELV